METTRACSTETRTFCAREADLVALLESASTRNESKLRQRHQRVRDCLVDHADELSPECVAALVGNVATQHGALPNDDADATLEAVETVEDQQPSEEQVASTPAQPPAPVVEQPAAKPVVKVSPQEPATPQPAAVYHQQQPQYVQTTAEGDAGIEVRIFLINHPEQAAAAPAPQYIRIGGDSNQQFDGDLPPTGVVAATSAGGASISAWVWVAVLPFMCIGMYVSVVQTLAFIRRRRDVVYRVGAAQYMPIPSSLNPSK